MSLAQNQIYGKYHENHYLALMTICNLDIKNWKQGRKLGSGSYGAAYLYKNTSSEELAACKELKIGSSDAKELQVFYSLVIFSFILIKFTFYLESKG